MEIKDIVNDLKKHPTKTYKTRPLSQIDGLVIHHFAAMATIENVAIYHVNSLDWPGIGYHYCVLASGEIFQTNYHETISYHVGNPNYKTIGIAMQGNFTHPNTPPQAQLDAVRWLVHGHLCKLPELNIKLVEGHGMYPGGTPTACPGNTHPQWLPYIKTPFEEITNAKIFDVSHWKGKKPIQIFVDEGADGLICKATEGEDFIDGTYSWYRDESAKIGLPFGSYHHFLTISDPVLQARNYYNVAHGHVMRPAVDVEGKHNEGVHPKDVFTYRLKDTLDEIEELWGIKPKIYTSAYMWDLLTTNPTWASEYELWVANYNTSDPKLPKHFDGWVFWQWTNTYKIDGINYDANWFNGDKDKFSAYLENIKPPEPEPEIPELINMKWHSLRFYPLIGKEYTRSTLAPEMVDIEGLPDDTRLVMIRVEVQSNEPSNYISMGIDGRMVKTYANQVVNTIMEVRKAKTFIQTKVKSGTSMKVWIEGYGAFSQT